MIDRCESYFVFNFYILYANRPASIKKTHFNLDSKSLVQNLWIFRLFRTRRNYGLLCVCEIYNLNIIFLTLRCSEYSVKIYNSLFICNNLAPEVDAYRKLLHTPDQFRYTQQFFHSMDVCFFIEPTVIYSPAFLSSTLHCKPFYPNSATQPIITPR